MMGLGEHKHRRRNWGGTNEGNGPEEEQVTEGD